MFYIKINNIIYPVTIQTDSNNFSWDNRSTRTLTLEIDYIEAITLFKDNITWSIIREDEDEDGNVSQEEYDSSDYCLVGDIIYHRDKTVSVVMGKLTDSELLQIIMGKDYDE